MSFDAVKIVQELIKKRIGDRSRLEHILDRLKTGKYIYLSDQKYIEQLLASRKGLYSEESGSSTELESIMRSESELQHINNQLEKTDKVKPTREKISIDSDLTDKNTINKKIIDNSKKKYEHLLTSREISQFDDSEPKIELESLKRLESELQNINNQLEKIDKIKPTKISIDSDLTDKNTINKKIIDNSKKQFKNEDFVVILSTVLGLISLQGIGHIYLGRVARGVGILVLSLFISALSIFSVLGMAKNYFLISTTPYFAPVLIIGFFGLYIFQILDGRKLCITYNRYVVENGKSPPWW